MAPNQNIDEAKQRRREEMKRQDSSYPICETVQLSDDPRFENLVKFDEIFTHHAL